MPHVIEPAASGRATCRACGQKIASGVLRFGERIPNPYSDDGGETTHWFHLDCAAYRRPETFLSAVTELDVAFDDRDRLVRAAELGVAHRRLPRIAAASLAPTGRATCRACKALIEKDTWRIGLTYYEDGRFTPGGFVHASCVPEYFETTDVMDRVRHFTPGLSDADAADLGAALQT